MTQTNAEKGCNAYLSTRVYALPPDDFGKGLAQEPKYQALVQQGTRGPAGYALK